MTRKLAGLIARLAKSPETGWHPVGQPYPRLIDFDPAAAGLVGVGGVAAIWHLGVRPQWLRIVATRDLAAALTALKTLPAVLTFQPNGGLYVAWRLEPAASAPGVAAFLRDAVRPVFSAPPLPGEWPAGGGKKVACPLPPGAEQPTPA